jgi:hypothetical protein
MTADSYEDATKKHAQHMAERDKLTEAAPQTR